MGARQRAVRALGLVERAAERLPGPARDAVVHALSPLRTVLLELPTPAVGVVGGRHEDRVWLGTLLAGGGDLPWAQRPDGWWEIQGPRGDIHVWDADRAPEAGDPSALPLDARAPDVWVVLPGADPAALARLQGAVEARHDRVVPVVGALGGQAASGGLARAVDVKAWARALEDGGLDGVGVVDPRGPAGVDALVRAIVDAVRVEVGVALVRTSGRATLVEERCRSLVTAAATAASAIAATPLPVADSVPLGALQLVLVLGIARLAGRQADLASARELAAAAGVQLGGAVAFREVARALVKFVPGWGSAVSAGIAWAGTAAIGEAAIAWFVYGRLGGRRGARALERSSGG